MIKKYLILGKQVHLSSSKSEDEFGTVRNIDLVMPLEIYWKVKKMLSESDVIAALGEPSLDATEVYRRVFRVLCPYAVYEVDRSYLRHHATPSSAAG